MPSSDSRGTIHEIVVVDVLRHRSMRSWVTQ